MQYLSAILVAILAALVAYSIHPLPANYFAKKVDAAYTEKEDKDLPFYRGMLAPLAPLMKYTPLGWVRMVERQVYWCQLAGKWTDWSTTEIMALHLALGLGGGSVALLLRQPVHMIVAWAAAPVFLLNIIYLNAPARKMRKQMASELPEFVSILSAEVASGTSLQEAVARTSRGPGACAAWFRQVQAGAVGKPLFSLPGKAGALFEEARTAGDRDLIMLARTLDNIERRGTGQRELLSQVATDTASRFIGEANMRAEKVGSEIILPMIFFFFLPYIVVILSVMAGPIMRSGIF